jgi:hypothetical protein
MHGIQQKENGPQTYYAVVSSYYKEYNVIVYELQSFC